MPGQTNGQFVQHGQPMYNYPNTMVMNNQMIPGQQQVYGRSGQVAPTMVTD